MPDFDTFDWSDERWQTYYKSLYPQPSIQQTLKFKRKWFKREIDPNFNDEIDTQETASTGGTPAPATKTTHLKSSSDWSVRMFILASLAGGIVLSIIGMLSAGRAQAFGCLALAVGFIGSLLLKYGVPKLNAAYWQMAFSSDALHALMMLMAAIPVLGSPFAMASPLISALMECQPLCESLNLAPQVSKTLGAHRYDLARWRARMEVVQGALLIIDVIRGRIRFMQPFVYWHTLRLKSSVDPFLGEVFRSFHLAISRALSHPAVPASVSNVYAKIYGYLSR